MLLNYHNPLTISPVKEPPKSCKNLLWYCLEKIFIKKCEYFKNSLIHCTPQISPI